MQKAVLLLFLFSQPLLAMISDDQAKQESPGRLVQQEQVPTENPSERAISTHSVDYLFSHNTNLTCLIENLKFKRLTPSWEKVTGWSADFLQEKPISYFIYDEDLNEALLQLSSNEPKNFIGRMKTRDDRLIWLEWIVLAQTPSNGLLFLVRDVTLQKQTEQEVVTSLEEAIKFRSSSHPEAKSPSLEAKIHLLEGLINIQGAYAHHIFSSKLGTLSMSPSEVLIKHLVSLLKCKAGIIAEVPPPGDSIKNVSIGITDQSIKKSLDELSLVLERNPISTTSDLSSKRIALKKELYSEFAQSMAGVPLYLNEKLVGVLILFEPPTHTVLHSEEFGSLIKIAGRVIHNQQLYRETRNTIQTLDKVNQQKVMFVASMSHEIRTLLNGIIGALELINLSSLSEENAEYVSLSKSSANSLLSLSNDILDYSKLESGQLSLEEISFNPFELAEEVTAFFKVQAEKKGIVLELTKNTVEHPVLLGDPTRINQILFNLIGNAVKFTPSGKVSTQVRYTVENEDSVNLEISVQDTGIGISYEAQKRLFQPFSQAEDSMTRRFGGSGLGLYITRELISRMSGNISVESKEGYGSTFKVNIPLKISKNIPRKDSLPSGDKLPADLRILVTEDNPSIQLILKNILQREGCKVTLANNGAEALRLVQESPAYFQVILMDACMPVMDGVTASRRIRSLPEGRDIPIIGITALGTAEDRTNFYNAGITSYLSKPIQSKKLIAEIQNVLRVNSKAGNLP